MNKLKYSSHGQTLPTYPLFLYQPHSIRAHLKDQPFIQLKHEVLSRDSHVKPPIL